MKNNLDLRIERLKSFLIEIIGAKEHSFSERKIPKSPGIYLIIKKDTNDIIYVGETENLRQRIVDNLISGDKQAHILRKKLAKTYNLKTENEITDFLKENFAFKFKETNIEPKERKAVEHFLIAVINPLFNDLESD
jgi:excinuclease UvrABC nuclease subunit